MAAMTLMPDCVLPGCHEPVILVGEACPDCREVFGAMLVERPGLPGMTAESIEARDGAVLAAYALQRDDVCATADQSVRPPGGESCSPGDGMQHARDEFGDAP